MDSVPTFDIFAGTMGDRDALWICSVTGLAAAKERMDQIAAEKPGRYFVFSVYGRCIVANTETFAGEQAERKKTAGE